MVFYLNFLFDTFAALFTIGLIIYAIIILCKRYFFSQEKNHPKIVLVQFLVFLMYAATIYLIAILFPYLINCFDYSQEKMDLLNIFKFIGKGFSFLFGDSMYGPLELTELIKSRPSNFILNEDDFLIYYDFVGKMKNIFLLICYFPPVLIANFHFAKTLVNAIDIGYIERNYYEITGKRLPLYFSTIWILTQHPEELHGKKFKEVEDFVEQFNDIVERHQK